MSKIKFHILFWVFIWLYVFDYFIDLYSFGKSVSYTFFEVSIYISEFYINLLLLLPLLLEKKRKGLYFLILSIVLTVFCSSFFITGMNRYLLDTNTLRAVSSFLLNHLLFILMSYFVWYFKKYEEEKRNRLQLENEKLQAEMLLLKTQISPHFLFNALNNIYSLTLLKSDDAPKMLATLSDILRYFLYEGSKRSVFLDAEIEIISKYIQIQKYRRIPGMNNIEFKIEGISSNLKVPTLIYLTLIENAFKHGDVIENEKGFVSIKFEITPIEILFTIENSFVPHSSNEGIGLTNVKSQLDILFKENYRFDISKTATNFKIILTLKINQNEKI
ncbi:MAG: histidine kinase [Flavobacteriia bacterium]|nr:histidine kinase [Flavobacteriia bacterium]